MAAAKRRVQLDRPKVAHDRARRQRRLHTATAIAVVAWLLVMLVSVAAYSAYAKRQSWNSWFGGFDSGDSGQSEGGRSQSDAADAAFRCGELAYGDSGYAVLGMFCIGRFDPLTETTITLDFRLEGTTTCGDRAEFEQFMRNNYQSFREQVMLTVRDCRTADLVDQEVMERRIRVRLNRAFGRRLLESATLHEFHAFESIGSYGSEPWPPGG